MSRLLCLLRDPMQVYVRTNYWVFLKLTYGIQYGKTGKGGVGGWGSG